jgi:hypothetical protein
MEKEAINMDARCVCGARAAVHILALRPDGRTSGQTAICREHAVAMGEYLAALALPVDRILQNGYAPGMSELALH